MVTPTNLYLWLSQQAVPLALLAAIVAAIYMAARWSALSRRRALNRQRHGVDEEAFAEYLAGFGFDRTVTAATYRYLQQVQHVDFPILPSDSLDEDLGLAPEDLQQTVRDLSAALGREPQLGVLSGSLVSVEDLARLLQTSPRMANRRAA